jgi:hypothetical protein
MAVKDKHGYERKLSWPRTEENNRNRQFPVRDLKERHPEYNQAYKRHSVVKFM